MVRVDEFSEFLKKQRVAKGSSTKLGEMVGMSGKSIDSYILKRSYGSRNSRINSGNEITQVKLDLVDRCAIKLGYHPSEIYPDYFDWPTNA